MIMTSFLLFECVFVSLYQLSSCSNSPTIPTLVTTPSNFREKPALSLQPEVDSDTVGGNLKRGVKVKKHRDLILYKLFYIQNPFSALGLKSLKIVNKIQFCEDGTECNEITDFLPRGKQFLPDVLAFFVPTPENFTGRLRLGTLLQL